MIDMSLRKQLKSPGFLHESADQLLSTVQEYMPQTEAELVQHALQLAQETCSDVRGQRALPPLEYALAVASLLAQMHIDAVGVASGLVFEAVDADLVSLERVEAELGVPVARVVGSMLRMNILERTKQTVAQVAQPAAQGDSENTREQKKQRIRDALRRQQAETVRKMLFAMSEAPRVVILKLAYRPHAMRLICEQKSPADHQEKTTMAQE